MNYRTALIAIMVILSGLFITCTSATTFCNNIPAGVRINNDLFSLENLAFGEIGFPGETGSIEMTDEILERIRTSPEYEDRLNNGFIIKLSSDDEKTYYEIFPGGTGIGSSLRKATRRLQSAQTGSAPFLDSLTTL